MPIVLLDSYPLSLVSHPGRGNKQADCKRWAQRLVRQGILIVVPEIVDYELRRKLLQGGKSDAIDKLNGLGDMGLTYSPITTEVTRKAAELWAWARNSNQSTAHAERIDVDAFIGAHAITLAEELQEYVVVATSNVKHIARYTPAQEWNDITPEHCFDSRIPARTELGKVSAAPPHQ